MIIDRDNFEEGTHLIICALCHRTIKFNKAARNWNKLWVCRNEVQEDPAIYLKQQRRPTNEGETVADIQKDEE